MLSQIEPTVKGIIAFLKLLNIKVNTKSVNDTLLDHPDWPSLLSISDSLLKWNIPNAAGKVEPAQLDSLPVPFIVYTSNYDHPVEIVTSITESNIGILTYPYKTSVSKSRTEFIQQWDGVYLIAEPVEISGEADYHSKRQRFFVQKLVPFLAISIILSLSFLTLHFNMNVTFANAIRFLYIQYFLLIAGVGVTSLLLWYEIDKNNPFLKKVCTGISKGNCNAILTSTASKVFSWLSWSELGFFYFAGSFLVLCMPGFSGMNKVQLLGWLNLLVLPYTFYSIYYQWQVAKQWCVLCLAVQAIIVSGSLNTFFNLFPPVFPQLSEKFLLFAVFLFSAVALIWLSLKPAISRLQEHATTKREYLRMKFNTHVFYNLLHKEKKITEEPTGLGINIGNPDAMYTLIKICNPYCGPCSEAHPKLEKVLEVVPQLQLKIIFVAPNHPDNLAFKVVRHFMAIAEEYDPVEARKALGSWYLGEKKEYEDFAARYPVNQDLKKPSPGIEAMFNWCRRNNTNYTPTYFLNGHQLPATYGIADLQYFLLD